MTVQPFRYDYSITPAQTDGSGRLKYSEMLRLSQDVSGLHCTPLGADTAVLDKKGLFWAIIRNQITVSRLPMAGQRITLETWPMPTSRTCYPRAVAAYDDRGDPLFACHSLWILMDKTSRGMVLPGKSGIDVPGIIREDAPPAPKSLSPVTGGQSFLRQVCNEDLDQNCHMNNARYLDWVTEALPAEFLHSHRLNSATLCYLNEVTLGQELDMRYTVDDENTVHFDICRGNVGEKSDRIFSAKVSFDSVVL